LRNIFWGKVVFVAKLFGYGASVFKMRVAFSASVHVSRCAEDQLYLSFDSNFNHAVEERSGRFTLWATSAYGDRDLLVAARVPRLGARYCRSELVRDRFPVYESLATDYALEEEIYHGWGY